MIDARIQQEIVIRSEERTATLAEATRLLYDMGINVLAVDVSTCDTHIEIHLLTNSQSYAFESLRDAGYEVRERDIIVIELPHYPGFLCRVSEALARKDLEVIDLHAAVPETGSKGVVVFTTSNNAHAVQILRGK